MGRKVTPKKVNCVVEGHLDCQDLYPVIRKLVPEAPKDAEIEVYVDVPGGGDWSNMRLDVSEENRINFTVSWEEIE